MKAPGDSTVDCTREQIDEAAVWMTMLHSSGRSSRTDQGFRRWMEAHPAHPLAFEQVCIAHEMTAAIALRPLPPADLWRRKAAAKRHGIPARAFAVAAATCAAMVAGVLVYRTYFEHRYTTDVGEQRTITLADGSQVFLNTGSSIVVRYDKRTRAIELERGEALFEVATGQPNRPFTVTADRRRITALGTAFLVKKMQTRVRGIFPLINRTEGAASERLQVTLLHGKIIITDTQADGSPTIRDQEDRLHGRGAASPGTTRGLLLDPGQRLTFAGNLRPKVDAPNLETVTAWRSGRVEFQKIPLAEAVAEMNRYGATQLRIEQPESANLVITGTFRAGAAESFAHAMAAAYQLEVIAKPGEIILAGHPGPVSRPARASMPAAQVADPETPPR